MLVVADPYLAAAGEGGLALEKLGLVLVPEELDAVLECLGNLRSPFLQRLPIDLRLPGFYSELAAVGAHRVEDLGCVQHGLGRDAGVVEAAAAGLVPLDHGRLLPELGCADRGHIAPGPAADDNHVVLRHEFDSIGGDLSASPSNGLRSRAPSHLR